MLLKRACLQWRRRHREQSYGHGGEGEGGTNEESNMDTYKLPHVKPRASGNLLLTRGTHIRSLWPPRGVGWGGRLEGGKTGRGHMYDSR